MSAWRAPGGYSLPDLLVSTAVAGLVLAAMLGILRSGLSAYGWGAARVSAQQGARIAVERMARELREAGYDPRGAGIAAIVVAEPARVTFQRDLDGDGLVDPTSERVTLLLRPGESVLRRDAGGGAQPLVNDVRRFALRYFDRRGVETVDPAAVASIGIELEVGQGAAALTMRTEVALRTGG